MSNNGSSSPDDLAVSLRRYVSLTLANLTPFCLMVAVCVLSGLIVSYILPKKYEASSTVFIEQNVISDLVKGIAITPSIDAKLRILKVSLLSRATLLGVAEELGMKATSQTAAEEERFIEALRAQADIRQDEKRGLFFITYTDSDPKLARNFVNTITRRYIEESTASKRKESFEATSFLENQIKVFQTRIDVAQQAIDKFKVEKGMYLGLDEHLLREQIHQWEQRLETVRIQKSEQAAKLELYNTQPRLAESLEEQELALQRLLAAYTERHPAVQRARDDIRALKSAIAAAAQKNGTVAPGMSIEYQKAKVELQSLEEVEANLRASVAKNTAYLQELPVIRTELSALEQTKHNETIIYQQLVSRFGQSEVSKQMELQDKAVNFRVIDPAVLPATYVSPNRSLIILGSIGAGIALGFGMLVIHDFLRSRVRSRKDLHSYGLEVLATLPRLATPGNGQMGKGKRRLVTATVCLLVMACAVAAMEFLRLPYIEYALSRMHLL